MSPRVRLLALGLLLSARARADDLDALMQLLAQRSHAEVSFVEQHFLKLLSRPVESMGELRFDAPDRLEKHTLEPRDEDLKVEGDVLTMTRHGKTRVASLGDYPQIAPLIESIRATLAGDRAALERAFQLSLLGDLEHWALVLRPRDARIATRISEVRIDGDRDRLLTVAIRERDGDRSLITLREHPRR